MSATPENASGQRLQLDARQRAMLEEMGIRLWLPQAQAPAAATVTVASLDTAPVVAPAAPPAAQVPAAPQQRPAAGWVPQPGTPAASATPPAASGMPPLPAIHSDMDLPALRAAASQCQACALAAGRRNSVWDAPPAELPPGLPRWLWLLDAPDAPENATGKPLQGDAGQLLANMAAAIGLQPAQVYRAHATKCAPLPGRKVGQTELRQCAHWLRHEIARVQPAVILALGRHAAFSLLGSMAPLGQLRGQPHRIHVADDGQEQWGALAQIPVVVTYPPSYLLRNPMAKKDAWQDLCMAHALLAVPQQG